MTLPAAAASAAVVVLAGCGSASPAPRAVAKVSAAGVQPDLHATSPATARTKAKGKDAVSRCFARPASTGDIFVRMITPGQQAVAQELGGEWVWNSTTHSCMTSTRMAIATAPTGSGFCTQVGLVSDNPGYDPNATPARPLRAVAASAGGSC